MEKIMRLKFLCVLGLIGLGVLFFYAVFLFFNRIGYIDMGLFCLMIFIGIALECLAFIEVRDFIIKQKMTQ